MDWKNSRIDALFKKARVALENLTEEK